MGVGYPAILREWRVVVLDSGDGDNERKFTKGIARIKMIVNFAFRLLPVSKQFVCKGLI